MPTPRPCWSWINLSFAILSHCCKCQIIPPTFLGIQDWLFNQPKLIEGRRFLSSSADHKWLNAHIYDNAQICTFVIGRPEGLCLSSIVIMASRIWFGFQHTPEVNLPTPSRINMCERKSKTIVHRSRLHHYTSGKVRVICIVKRGNSGCARPRVRSWAEPKQEEKSKRADR